MSKRGAKLTSGVLPLKLMFNLFYKNSLLQGNLAAVLIIMMVFLAGGWVLLYPKPAQALSDGPAFGQRVIMAIKEAAKWAWEKVQAAYAYAADTIKTAFAIWQKSDTLLSRVTRVAATIALHTLLNMLTNQIIQWIQGGGEPKFISDWKGFLGDAGNRAGGLFVDKYLGAGWLCEPFDIAISIPLLSVPTFGEKVECTLEDMGINIRMFYDDFNEAGWMGWIELTKPQGNFYGGYLMAQTEKTIQEEKAKDAAGQEGLAGRGFLSVKVCVKGKIVDNFTDETYSTCDNSGSCEDLEESAGDDIDYSFICEEEKVSTPASVLSDITSRAMDREMDIIGQEIATMTANLGTYAPYVVAIGNALINRLIQEGLETIQSSGPTVENPDESMPPSDIIISIDSPAEAEVAEEVATIILDQEELLKENLEDQLLSQQQSNLTVIQSIETMQSDILDTLISIFQIDNCSLPSWANDQIIDSWTEPSSDSLIESDREIEIFEFTPSDIGSTSIEKTTWSEWDICHHRDGEDRCVGGWAFKALYETLETNLQISDQVLALEEEIGDTNQWIANIDTAITSTNGLFQAVDDYMILYDEIHPPPEDNVEILVHPTEEQQIDLDAATDNIETALVSLISDGGIAVESSPDDMMELSNDIQGFTMMINQIANDLQTALGMSAEYPEEDSLYAQKSSVQGSLSEVQIIYSACTAPEEENGGNGP